MSGLINGEAKKDFKKGLYTAAGGFVLVGMFNAWAVYNNTQTFMSTTSTFIKAQQDINTSQATANEQFRIALAELKQQSADQSRRLDMLETSRNKP